MKLLTTTGFKNIDDIVVGDSLIHEDSTTSLVTEKTPSDKVKYLLTMQDGTEITLTDQVDIEYHVARSGRKPKIKSIQEALVQFNKQVLRGPQQDNNIPKLITKLVTPVTFGAKDSNLLVDPYTLGAVLGDGCITQNTCKVTSADYQIIANIEKAGYVCNVHKDKQGDNAAKDYCVIGLAKVLKEYNLIGCNSYSKFIPPEYLMASVEDRFAIVQGLMDTDGYIDDGGSTEFCTISPQLKDGIRYLLQSLGFTVTVSEKKPFYRDKHGDRVAGQLAYNLYIRGNDQGQLFRLDRKLDRVKSKRCGNRIDQMVVLGESSTCEIFTESNKPVLAEGFIPVFLRKKGNYDR